MFFCIDKQAVVYSIHMHVACDIQVVCHAADPHQQLMGQASWVFRPLRYLQKLPEAVRSCSKLIQLDVAANDNLDAIPTGAYLANLRDLDLSRCDFHRCQAFTSALHASSSPCYSCLRISSHAVLRVSYCVQKTCVLPYASRTSTVHPQRLTCRACSNELHHVVQDPKLFGGSHQPGEAGHELQHMHGGGRRGPSAAAQPARSQADQHNEGSAACCGSARQAQRVQAYPLDRLQHVQPLPAQQGTDGAPPWQNDRCPLI